MILCQVYNHEEVIVTQQKRLRVVEPLMTAAIGATGDLLERDPLIAQLTDEKIKAEKRAEELERMFGWITRRATEGRGLIAFCATEDGDVGLFRDVGDNDKSIGKGDDAEEAVLAAIANEEPRT